MKDKQDTTARRLWHFSRAKRPLGGTGSLKGSCRDFGILIVVLRGGENLKAIPDRISLASKLLIKLRDNL
jgi:hypothetical protein